MNRDTALRLFEFLDDAGVRPVGIQAHRAPDGGSGDPSTYHVSVGGRALDTQVLQTILGNLPAGALIQGTNSVGALVIQ